MGLFRVIFLVIIPSFHPPISGVDCNGNMAIEYPINVLRSVLCKDTVELIDKVANLSSSHSWTDLIKILVENKDKVNYCRLPEDGTPPKLFTPLHQAADGTAPKEVIEKLLKLGASKTFKTSDGKTAFDIAVHRHMEQEALTLLQIPSEIKEKEEEIEKMEKGLHEVILGRAKNLIEKNEMQLPQLSFLYEFGEFWYPIPGMYGGFNVQSCDEGVQTESWCRVVGGSGQRHVIDRQGNVRMTEEAFV